MNREYLSFECWCVEVVGITYYNSVAPQDLEDITNDYIMYCEKNNLEHDYE